MVVLNVRERLKSLLSMFNTMIDAGQCDNCTDVNIEEILSMVEPKTMGREAAATYLGISLNRFHELRDLGVIPEPRSRKGFKEKEYYISDLNKIKDKIKK